MPRMSKKRKLELSFFLNDRGRVAYNDLCRKCQHECKQSFRATVMNEKLEKLNQQLAQGEARLRRAQHEQKILEHQMKQLTRKERTHRLCARGAILESFLIRPEVLTDDDVMDILKQAFSQSGMKETVAESVKRRVAGESLTE